MDRRVRLLAVVLVLAACSGDDDDDAGADAPPTTAAEQAPPTLPDDVDAGRGAMMLDGEAAVLTVTECNLETRVDETTGVAIEVEVRADDGTGRAVELTRSSFTADAPAVTDTILVIDGEDVLESSRVDQGGRIVDLRLENPVGPLLDIEDGVIRAEGVFGPVGSTIDDPDNVEGELLLRCP